MGPVSAPTRPSSYQRPRLPLPLIPLVGTKFRENGSQPISESHVRYLYQHVYLPLLACHERQQRGRLAQVAQEQGGLVVALDGLAPQGGEPQIWFIRDLSTGLTLRSGWLAQLDQPTIEAFLARLRHLEWAILAVLSAKQTG